MARNLAHVDTEVLNASWEALSEARVRLRALGYYGLWRALGEPQEAIRRETSHRWDLERRNKVRQLSLLTSGDDRSAA